MSGASKLSLGGATMLAGGAMVAFFGFLMLVTVLTGSGTAGASEEAIADIPADYLAHYQGAGEKYGLDWAILAAIGKIESDHGRGAAQGIRSGVNFAGCCGGPMQFYFMPHAGKLRASERNSSTWGKFAVDADSDGWKTVWNPADAIYAAGNYLKASGAPGDYRRAIFAYNHADWYVNQVLAQAELYRGALPAGGAADLSGDWVWPTESKILTSPFGPRAGRNHDGVDIAGPVGNKLFATRAGKVTFASMQGGYGNYTCVAHGSGMSSCYAHQSKIGVHVGQEVGKGQVIGLLGNTGHSTGPHLHFEIRINGNPVNPMPYLRGTRAATSTTTKGEST